MRALDVAEGLRVARDQAYVATLRLHLHHDQLSHPALAESRASINLALDHTLEALRALDMAVAEVEPAERAALAYPKRLGL